MSKKVLFLTTHNLATNPRLVKEIELALQNKYRVSVLCFEFDNWSKALNEDIKTRFIPQITYHSIPGNRKPLGRWLKSTVIFFLSGTGLVFFPRSVFLLSLRSNKRSWFLWAALKKVTEKFDFVVAHNPGSFYPAYAFAKKNKIPFGIDLEDYHPGESHHKKAAMLYKNLNRAVLPRASYVTAASPLILDYSEADLRAPLKNKKVVLNYFPPTEFIKPAGSAHEKLQLVWFSQNISFNRGIEQLIPAIKNSEKLELHLFGNCDEDFIQQWLDDCNNVQLHPALPQAILHQRLSHYDIGLAIEPGKDINNELAVSNKILAYFQSGLYILASNTKAQGKFMNEYPGHGSVTSLEPGDLKETIQRLIDQKQLIRASSEERFERAKEYNWENESLKLAETWNGLH